MKKVSAIRLLKKLTSLRTNKVTDKTVMLIKLIECTSDEFSQQKNCIFTIQLFIHRLNLLSSLNNVLYCQNVQYNQRYDNVIKNNVTIVNN